MFCNHIITYLITCISQPHFCNHVHYHVFNYMHFVGFSEEVHHCLLYFLFSLPNVKFVFFSPDLIYACLLHSSLFCILAFKFFSFNRPKGQMFNTTRVETRQEKWTGNKTGAKTEFLSCGHDKNETRT